MKDTQVRSARKRPTILRFTLELVIVLLLLAQISMLVSIKSNLTKTQDTCEKCSHLILPRSFVMNEPECTNKLLNYSGITNVRIIQNESALKVLQRVSS